MDQFPFLPARSPRDDWIASRSSTSTCVVIGQYYDETCQPNCSAADMYVTTDGGIDWSLASLPGHVSGETYCGDGSYCSLGSVACVLGASLCIVTGVSSYGTFVDNSTDGGQTWNPATDGGIWGSDTSIGNVDCPTTELCLATTTGCDNSGTYYSTDEGDSWESATNYTGGPNGLSCASAAALCHWWRSVYVGRRRRGLFNGPIRRK